MAQRLNQLRTFQQRQEISRSVRITHAGSLGVGGGVGAGGAGGCCGGQGGKGLRIT